MNPFFIVYFSSFVQNGYSQDTRWIALLKWNFEIIKVVELNSFCESYKIVRETLSAFALINASLHAKYFVTLCKRLVKDWIAYDLDEIWCTDFKLMTSHLFSHFLYWPYSILARSRDTHVHHMNVFVNISIFSM